MKYGDKNVTVFFLFIYTTHIAGKGNILQRRIFFPTHTHKHGGAIYSTNNQQGHSLLYITSRLFYAVEGHLQVFYPSYRWFFFTIRLYFWTACLTNKKWLDQLKNVCNKHILYYVFCSILWICLYSLKNLNTLWCIHMPQNTSADMPNDGNESFSLCDLAKDTWRPDRGYPDDLQ